MYDKINEPPIRILIENQNTDKVSRKNNVNNNFSDTWERIKKECQINSYNQLSKIIGTSQPNISRRKKENSFPADWAFIIAQKYGLSTDWIMTGQGPKRLNEQIRYKPEERTIQLLDEWLKEISKNEPDKKIWFRYQIEETFPKFKEWLKRKEKERKDNSNQKVA